MQPVVSASHPGVWSETAALVSCALVPPGPEHDYMVPAHLEAVLRSQANWWANPDYLLFDDLVLLPQLRAEHAELMAVIAAATQSRDIPSAVSQCGWQGRAGGASAGYRHAGAIDLRQWLRHILASPQVAAEVVAEVCDMEVQRGPLPIPVREVRARLGDLGGEELLHALLSGVCPHTEQQLLRTPAPNLLFARDLLACMGEAIVLGWPQMPARWRDGVLARALARHHPALCTRPQVDVRSLRSGACLEGGDILVASGDLVLVGVGERTNAAGAEALHQALQTQRPTRVLAVHLPPQRAMMHLDTVFTWLDRGLAVAYMPVFSPESPPEARVDIRDLSSPGQSLGADLAAVLADYGAPTELLPCGGGLARHAEREQWSDGANALCLAPGQVVLYGRNTHTLRTLNAAGFEILTPQEYVANAALYQQRGQRLVVALTGSELSRGRGGPRCLTLPLGREPELAASAS